MYKFLKITLTSFTSIILLLGFALPLNPPAGNWYQQLLPNIGSKQINDITFLDSLIGFAVASRNANPDTATILKTTNGGDNWQVVFTQTPRRFSRIKFINSLTGFISGGSGSGTPYLYKSTDAGNNWVIVSGATLGTNYWDDMAVLNEDTIWLVDDNGLSGGVYITINGGLNWQGQYFNTIRKIYMYNRNIGFCCTNFNLYKTTNSGFNWIQIIGESGFNEMYFSDSLTGWKADGNMKKTTNGGLNWIAQVLPSGGIITTTGISSFTNLNKDTIWGVGGRVQYPNLQTRAMIYRTTNGGNNWLFQIPDTAINVFFYVKIQFINKNMGWAYAINKGIHTTNGGDTNFFVGLEQISNEIPKEFKLYQNYPNPFNPKTNIKYLITNTGFVNLIVYDITGRQLIDLVNRNQAAGTYEADFSGTAYSSSVYFYSLLVDGIKIATKKMILVK